MRSTLAILLFAAIGCGGGTNNNGTDQGVSNDLSMSSSRDMAMAAGGNDMAMAAGACDIAKQTGCSSTQKCIPLFASQGMVSGTCVDNGTIAESAACTTTSEMDRLNDNCVAGTSCDADGANAAPLCRKLCAANTDCTTGQKCFAFFDPSFGVCLPTCTPFSNECPTGNACTANFPDIGATQSNLTGYFYCKKIGTGAFGDMCMVDADCGADLFCDPTNGCTPSCDSTHSCLEPGVPDGGALSCQSYSNTPNGAGFCG